MKNELQAVEVVNDKVLIEYLDVMGLTSNLEEKEKTQFFTIAKTFGLNPFKREIFCNVYGQGQFRQLSIITGYEVYIKRAERSGQLDGWSATTSGSVATNDLKATVTIYRKDRQHPFVWEAYYDECVQTTKEGKVTKFWQKANFMTKKVAISQGFRLCFSDELGGMPYTSDEMPSITEDVTHEVIEAQPLQIEEPKKPVKLSQVQVDKVMNAGIEEIEKYLNLVEEGKVTMTQVQVLNLEDKLTELRNQ